MLKISRLSSSCDDGEYKTVFFDDFLGDDLDPNVWLKGYNDDPPYDVIGKDTWTTWAYPDFVKVENGVLKLLIEPIDPARRQKTWINKSGQQVTQTRRFGGGVIVSNNKNFNSSSQSGCLHYGKYSIRAKLPYPASDSEPIAAFWFYGWAGEVDQFEMCIPDCEEIQHTVHQWSIRPCHFHKPQYQLIREAPPGDCPVEPHASLNVDSGLPSGFSNNFNTYTFEWTPYKMIWSVNGVVTHSYYRYYELELGNASPCYDVQNPFHPLECNEIPKDQLLDNVWESISWNRFSEFFMDLI